MIYLELYISFFKIGLLSIGGGYAVLPMIRSEIIEYRHWLTLTEFKDVITISTMTPGPIAINASTFVGVKMGGVPGAIIATLGCVTPSFIIVLFLGYIYYKYRNLTIINGTLNGLRPVVVGLIASAGIKILVSSITFGEYIKFESISLNYVSILIFLMVLIALKFTKVHSICMILVSGVFGVLFYGLFGIYSL